MTILTSGHVAAAPRNRRSVGRWLASLLSKLLNRMAGYPGQIEARDLSAHAMKDLGLSGELDSRYRRSPMDWPMW